MESKSIFPYQACASLGTEQPFMHLPVSNASETKQGKERNEITKALKG